MPFPPNSPRPPWTDKLQQVQAGQLDIGFVQDGPRDGTAAILLHGWPYDIHTYADVAPRLAAAGLRVIVPYLRGFGTTRLAASSPRNAQQATLALDVLALMDALGLETAILGGCDWGSRAAATVAALRPERCRGVVLVSGYLISSQAAGRAPLEPAAELAWWYQYYLATERGRAGYATYRAELARLLWRNASPRWMFDDETFARTASAFDNPDHVDIVVHNYRWRLGLAESDPRLAEYEARLEQQLPIRAPAITMEGDCNGAPHPEPATYADRFLGRYEHRSLTGGIGHNLPQEAPEAFAAAVIDVMHWSK